MADVASSISPDNKDSREESRDLTREAFIELCWARARLWRKHAGDNDASAPEDNTGFAPEDNTGSAQEDNTSSLHAAVDFLQSWAVNNNLVERIGQDAVQTIMAGSFGPYRTDLDWKATLDLGPPPPPSPPPYQPKPAHPAHPAQVLETEQQREHAPQVTVEAVMWSVRTHGLEALDQDETLERLSRCSEAQLEEINQRIALCLEKKSPSLEKKSPSLEKKSPSLEKKSPNKPGRIQS